MLGLNDYKISKPWFFMRVYFKDKPSFKDYCICSMPIFCFRMAIVNVLNIFPRSIFLRTLLHGFLRVVLKVLVLGFSGYIFPRTIRPSWTFYKDLFRGLVRTHLQVLTRKISKTIVNKLCLFCEGILWIFYDYFFRTISDLKKRFKELSWIFMIIFFKDY